MLPILKLSDFKELEFNVINIDSSMVTLSKEENCIKIEIEYYQTTNVLSVYSTFYSQKKSLGRNVQINRFKISAKSDLKFLITGLCAYKNCFKPMPDLLIQ